MKLNLAMSKLNSQPFVIVTIYWKDYNSIDEQYSLKCKLEQFYELPVYFLSSCGQYCSGDDAIVSAWILENNLDFNWEECFVEIAV